MFSPLTPTQHLNTIPITEHFRSSLSDDCSSRGLPTLFQQPRISDLDQESFDCIYEGRNPNDYEELLQYVQVPEREPTSEAQQTMAPIYSPVHYHPSTPPSVSHPEPQQAYSLEPGPQVYSQNTSTGFDVEMKETTHESRMYACVVAHGVCFDRPLQQSISQGNRSFQPGHPTPTPTSTTTMQVQMQGYTPDTQQSQTTYPTPDGSRDIPQSTQIVHQCTKTSKGTKKGSRGKYAGKAGKSYEERKKWLCPYCPMKATCKHNMKQHIRTHTGEKPFECDLCGNVYPRPWSVTRHLKSVHKLKHEDLKRYYQGRERMQFPSPAPNTQQFDLPDFKPHAPIALPTATPIAIAAPPTPEPVQIAGIRKDDINTWPWIFMTRLPTQSTVFSCDECNFANTFASAVDLQFHRHVYHHAAVSRRCACSICVHAFQNEMQAGVVGPVAEQVDERVADSETQPISDGFFPGMAQQETRPVYDEFAPDIPQQGAADPEILGSGLFVELFNQPYTGMSYDL